MSSTLKKKSVDIIEGTKIYGKSGYFDLILKEGKFDKIVKSKKINNGIIIPKLTDIHTHLDKTGTHNRINKKAKSLFEAIDFMDKDKLLWTEDDIYERAEKAIQDAWRNGTGFLRTHIDWIEERTPQAWNVLLSLQEKWKNKVAIEMASLSPIDLLPSKGEQISKVIRKNNSILGAFIYMNDNLEEKIKSVFEIADKYSLNLDFHVDEGLDKNANGIGKKCSRNALKQWKIGSRICLYV